MMIFIGLIVVLWMCALGIHLLGASACRKHFEDQPIAPDTPYGLIPVSILKPLKGVDSGLEENLESFFNLDYPHFEILFSVASKRDPAVAVVERLCARYPQIQTRLFVGEVVVGKNPKINNLIKSYEASEHPWVLISDSNIRVRPRYLKKLTSQIAADTGMLTSVVMGTGASGLGGGLETIHLNTFYAKAMILASLFKRDCVVGKSMLFRKSSAERFGGLRALGGFLAEDYMAGEAMKQLGLKVSTAWDAVPQYIGQYSVHDYWQRHIRWGRIRKAQSPLAFGLELLGSSLLPSLFFAIAGAFTFGWNGILLFLAHTLFWGMLDLVILNSMRAKLSPHTLLSWWVREALALPLWLHVACGNSVQWRGARYQLRLGGILVDPT